jgi:hypothetical protein
MVKGMQFICPLTVWQNGVVQGLADLQGPVHGSMHMAVYIQLLRLRNGRGYLRLIPRENMKQTLMEITTGNFGNGITDENLLKALIKERKIFNPSRFCTIYIYFYSGVFPQNSSWVYK